MVYKNIINQSKMNKNNMNLLHKNQNNHHNNNNNGYTLNNHHHNQMKTAISDESNHHSHFHNHGTNFHSSSSSSQLSLKSDSSPPIHDDYRLLNKHAQSLSSSSSDKHNFTTHLSPVRRCCPNTKLQLQFGSPSTSTRPYSNCSSCCSIEHDSSNRICFNKLPNNKYSAHSNNNHNHHRQPYSFNQYDNHKNNIHLHHSSLSSFRSNNYDHSIHSDSSSSYIDVNQLTAASNSPSLSSSDSLLLPTVDKYINVKSLSKSVLLDLLAQHEKQEHLENIQREQHQNQHYYNQMMNNHYRFDNNYNEDSILNDSKLMFDYSSTPKPIINHTTMILEGNYYYYYYTSK